MTITFLTSIIVAQLIVTCTSNGLFAVTPYAWTGPVNSELKLRCVYKNDPSKTADIISWMRTASLESEEVPEIIQNYDPGFLIKSFALKNVDYRITESVLLIHRVQFQHAGNYKCLVNGGTTHGGDESHLVPITVEPEIYVSPNIVTLELGKPFELLCQAQDRDEQSDNHTSNLHPKITRIGRFPQYEWYFNSNPTFHPYDKQKMNIAWKNSRLISYFQFYYRLEDQDSRLVVKKATRDHAGYYWCKVTFSDKTNKPQSSLVVVKYGPIFNSDLFKLEAPVKSFVGNNVNLTCDLDAFPSASIEWSILDRNSNRLIITNNSLRQSSELNLDCEEAGQRCYITEHNDLDTPYKLILNNVQGADQTEYTCTAVSFDGMMTSHSILLKVKNKYAAFFSFSLIILETLLFILLVFMAERIWTKKPYSSNNSWCYSKSTLSHAGSIVKQSKAMQVDLSNDTQIYVPHNQNNDNSMRRVWQSEV